MQRSRNQKKTPANQRTISSFFSAPSKPSSSGISGGRDTTSVTNTKYKSPSPKKRTISSSVTNSKTCPPISPQKTEDPVKSPANPLNDFACEFLDDLVQDGIVIPVSQQWSKRSSSLKRKNSDDHQIMCSETSKEATPGSIGSSNDCLRNKKGKHSLTPENQLSKKIKCDSPRSESPDLIPGTPEAPLPKKVKRKQKKLSLTPERATARNIFDSNDCLRNEKEKLCLTPEDQVNIEIKCGSLWPESPDIIPGTPEAPLPKKVKRKHKKLSFQSKEKVSKSSEDEGIALRENESLVTSNCDDMVLATILQAVPQSSSQNSELNKLGVMSPKKPSNNKNSLTKKVKTDENKAKMYFNSPEKQSSSMEKYGELVRSPLPPVETCDDEILNSILASMSPVKTRSSPRKKNLLSPICPAEENKIDFVSRIMFANGDTKVRVKTTNETIANPKSNGCAASCIEKQSCDHFNRELKVVGKLKSPVKPIRKTPPSKKSQNSHRSSASKYPAPNFSSPKIKTEKTENVSTPGLCTASVDISARNNKNEMDLPGKGQSCVKIPRSPLRRSPRKHGSRENSKCLVSQNNLAEKESIYPSADHKTVNNKSASNGDTMAQYADSLNLHDMFLDDHDEMALAIGCSEGRELLLDKGKRCNVVSIDIVKPHQEARMSVKCPDTGAEASVLVRGCWLSCPVVEGDVVNVEAVLCGGQWLLDSERGFLVLHPDTLISGTTVVGSMFCARRSVLSSLYRGIDSDSAIMVIGSLVHELLQMVLQQKSRTETEVKQIVQKLLGSKQCVRMLYAANMSMAQARKELYDFVPKIVNFVSTYVVKHSVENKRRSGAWLGAPVASPRPALSHGKKQHRSENWNGKIVGIRDIEENLWEPSLGIKGMVDVSVDIEDVAGIQKFMPLELKTGKASFSVEHRGQVTLYTMMMSKVGPPVESGLLLYLREGSIQEVRVSHRERKDLILLRNALAHYLVPRTPVVDPRTGTFVPLHLPEPIHFGSACEKCPYLTLCSVYLKQDGLSALQTEHPMVSLSKAATEHLSEKHIEYVMQWTAMLQLEDMERLRTAELRHIWCWPPEKRERHGRAIVNLCMEGTVTESAGKYTHTFIRKRNKGNDALSHDLRQTGLSAGDFIIVSTDTRLAVDHGNIADVTASTVTVIANRDLRKRNANETFHLDASESNTVMVSNLTNLGCLLDNTETAGRLRQAVIDKVQPAFSRHVDKTVLKEGASIFSALNEGQRFALLQTMKAEQYLLIKGMPGTGKTATMVALVRLLVRSGQSVLVTSHTHAAVDNLLLRLKAAGLRFVRLGPDARIHPDLLEYSESSLTSHCHTPEDMAVALSAQQIVGVTCLGAGHAMLARGRVFDVCLVDESTQVLQPSVLRPLFSARRFVLVGDPNQLPPVVRSREAREMGLDESLFVRLDSPVATVSLNLNYRMNRIITSVANGLTYNGDLKCGNEKVAEATLQKTTNQNEKYGSTWLSSALSSDIELSVVFVDTMGCPKLVTAPGIASTTGAEGDSSCTNQNEVNLVRQLLLAFIKAGVCSREVGVMAPYRAQVALLTQAVEALPALQGVEVNTVDQFQGRDKQVVIYSCTRSDTLQNEKPKEQEILNDQRRLTVAITRAKHKLILLGNMNTLKRYTPFKKLISCLTSEQITCVGED